MDAHLGSSNGWNDWHLGIDSDVVHALFHGTTCIPYSLAVLVDWVGQGSKIDPSIKGASIEESEMEIADGGEMSLIELEIPVASDRRPVQAMIAIAMTFIFIAHIVLIEISSHPEFEAQTEGDRALIQAIEELPSGSILYTAAHWGILYDVDSELGLTSFESRLVDGKERVQWDAERQF